MKKYLIITLLVLLLLGAKPARSEDSLYSSDAYHDAMYADNPTLNMAELGYSLAVEGTFKRQQDAWVADQPRYVTFSGSCAVKKEPIHIVAWLYTDSGTYPLIDSHDKVSAFNVSVLTQKISVVLTNQDGYYDTVAIKCSVRIEPQ